MILSLHKKRVSDFSYNSFRQKQLFLFLNISIAKQNCKAICYYYVTILNKKYIDFDNSVIIWRGLR